MKYPNGRIAVVVVHGMGNQFPMDTLRGFADALKPEKATAWSSPNRITDDTETRRLSFSTGPYDFFEYYWAHHVDEPGITAVLYWALKLLFSKKPSASLSKHIWKVRLFIFGLLGTAAAIAWFGYGFFKEHKIGLLAGTVIGIIIIAALKFVGKVLADTIVGKINSSIGDVINYTIPSPNNIAARDRIRKGGIELLKKLHEVKGDKGGPRYRKIIVAAHSLGTVVAYDILSSLFAQYHRSFEDIPDIIAQQKLMELKNAFENPDHTGSGYQRLQASLYNEYQDLGSQWRISNFITMGSPLTHASMIMANSPENFAQKKQQREYPTSPPQVDKEDQFFAFMSSYTKKTTADQQKLQAIQPALMAEEKQRILTLHHAAHFAATQWTNIYFKNDWIGGSLAGEFGKGIHDIEVKATGWWVRNIPLLSHTRYWDKGVNSSLEAIKKILERVAPV